jgi:hypothetical protein
MLVALSAGARIEVIGALRSAAGYQVPAGAGQRRRRGVLALPAGT